MKAHHRRKKKETKEIVGQSGLTTVVVVIINFFTPLKYPKNKKKISQTTKILKKELRKLQSWVKLKRNIKKRVENGLLESQ
jgi:hypothetical protein